MTTLWCNFLKCTPYLSAGAGLVTTGDCAGFSAGFSGWVALAGVGSEDAGVEAGVVDAGVEVGAEAGVEVGAWATTVAVEELTAVVVGAFDCWVVAGTGAVTALGWMY